MKIELIIILCLYGGSFLLPQKKVFDGIGDIRVGKTESEIFNALHVNRADIVEGSGETLHQFRESVYQSIVHVQYNPSSVLTKEVNEKRARHDYWYDSTAAPECYLYNCSSVDEYVIPAYEFDGITLRGFCLVFYKNKLVQIGLNSTLKFCMFDSIAYRFQKMYSDCDFDSYQAWDTSACGTYPEHLSWHWPKNYSAAAIKASWESDDICAGSGTWCQSYFEITDENFIKEMKTVCPAIKD